jgi:hypothetical protein
MILKNDNHYVKIYSIFFFSVIRFLFWNVRLYISKDDLFYMDDYKLQFN